VVDSPPININFKVGHTTATLYTSLYVLISQNPQFAKWHLSNRLQFFKKTFFTELLLNFLSKTVFVRDYYILNDLIWQDGFLIDFLQKKVIDKWLRRFVIYSGYIYSERLVFDFVIKFYIDFVIWAGHYYSIFEFSNTASTLLVTLFLAMWTVLLITLLYFW